MRVVIFYQYFGTPKGKWSTRVYELTRRWVDSGHQVTVVTAPYEKSDITARKFVEKQKVDGIDLIVINSADSNRNGIIKRIFYALVFSLMSCYYALSVKCDVVIASSGPITVGLPALFAKWLRRKPMVFEVRDLWPAGGIEMGMIKKRYQQSLALFFEKLCYKTADLIVVASIGQKEHIIKRFPELDIEVIPNASDIELFGKKSYEPLPKEFINKKILLHIGSLGLIHNTEYWVHIAKHLQDIDLTREIELIFIGDGADKDRLIQKTLEEKINNIHFLGLMAKEELPKWVQNSIATLFSTLDNVVQDTCSPNKIFDSFAASTPIVQTSKGWIKDLVNKERCGINIPIDNYEEAAQLIYEFSKDQDLIIEMGENAYRLASTMFNRDHLAKKYLHRILSIK